MEWIQSAVETAGLAIEAAGVAVIVIGAAFASLSALIGIRRSPREVYAAYRVRLARSILLGLEFLVAGDIIRTVVVAPTLGNVGLLGAVVLIRTFLSFTQELEVTGRLPWQRDAEHKSGAERTI